MASQAQRVLSSPNGSDELLDALARQRARANNAGKPDQISALRSRLRAIGLYDLIVGYRPDGSAIFSPILGADAAERAKPAQVLRKWGKPQSRDPQGRPADPTADAMMRRSKALSTLATARSAQTAGIAGLMAAAANKENAVRVAGEIPKAGKALGVMGAGLQLAPKAFGPLRRSIEASRPTWRLQGLSDGWEPALACP